MQFRANDIRDSASPKPKVSEEQQTLKELEVVNLSIDLQWLGLSTDLKRLAFI